MSIDEVVNFTYSRNPLWHKKLTKEQVRKTFEILKNNTIEARINGELVGVGVYIQFKDELHFISATMKEGIDGVSIMLQALKNRAKEKGVNYVSWYNPKNQLKRWEVRNVRKNLESY